jgi:DNA-binding transcriptional ArsR family regulator
MNAEPDISRIARTIGDPTRIRMLTLLMEGRALTAKELAYGSGVEPATASVHLQRLLADSLVVSTTQGRHKYFRLASPHVARCIESLMVVAMPGKASASTDSLPPIRLARFCYDHLAGRIATGIAQSLVSRKLLHRHEKDFVLTASGERWFRQFGIDPAALAGSRRRFLYPCLDWSERQDHLGGALAAALAKHMIESRWLKRKPDTRIAFITQTGREALLSHFGVHCD